MKMRMMWAVAGLWVLHSGMAPAQERFVGQKLPPLKLDYLQQTPDIAGKPVLLEFWATWCPPCRQSIPHLNELHGKYADRGLVIIGVTDEKKGDVKKFLKDLPMEYAVAFDTGKLAKHFQVHAIPHAFLANAEGVIVWQGHPMGLREEHIERVLKP